jgi:hypothetical protein
LGYFCSSVSALFFLGASRFAILGQMGLRRTAGATTRAAQLLLCWINRILELLPESSADKKQAGKKNNGDGV